MENPEPAHGLGRLGIYQGSPDQEWIMNSEIPKRLIQIWGGGSEPSLLGKAAATNLRLLHPDFDYLLFNDRRMQELLELHYPEYLDVFHSFQIPVQRYDFFRYLAIYHHGGFYFDFDVFLASNLTDLLNRSCVFPFEELTINQFLRDEYGMDWEIGNFGFGAAPGHPFIKAIIDNCVRAQRDNAWTAVIMRPIPKLLRQEFLVFYTTGPGLVSRTLAEFPDAGRHLTVLFPKDVCDRRNWGRFGHYGVHLQQGAWRSRKSFLRRRLISAWMAWQRSRMLTAALRRGSERSLDFTGTSQLREIDLIL
jgi:mannosyltransferase OCH1-like enzyme